MERALDQGWPLSQEPIQLAVSPWDSRSNWLIPERSLIYLNYSFIHLSTCLLGIYYTFDMGKILAKR